MQISKRAGLGLALACLMGSMMAGPATAADKASLFKVVTAKDEIGDMARAVEVFKANMIRTGELSAAREQERRAELSVAEREETRSRVHHRHLRHVLDRPHGLA